MKSPEQQLAICRAYLTQKGIAEVDVVRDLDLSGSDFAKRKISQIIDRIRAGEADAIVVWEYSRFGRTLIGSLFYIKELQEAGGDLLSATQDIDASTAAGRYMRDQFLRLAEYQLDQIRDSWRSTHQRRLNKGLPHGGQPRFGYLRCPGCQRSEENPARYVCQNKCEGLLVHDPVRGPALAKAYRRFVDGDTLYAIARDAWEEGVTSLRGSRMTADQWRVVMDSGFAAGYLRSVGQGPKPTNSRPDSYPIWYDGAHDALISQATWDSYVELRLRQADAFTREREPKWSCTSMVRCGESDDNENLCLRIMRTAGGNSRGGTMVRAFRCAHSENHASGKTVNIRAARVDALVLDWIRKNAQGVETVQDRLDQREEIEVSRTRIVELERSIKTLLQRKQRINEGYEAGLNDLETAKARMVVADTEVREKKADLKRLMQQLASVEPPSKEKFSGLAEVWDSATPAERRKALRKVIRYVIVTPPRGGEKVSSMRIVPLWEPDIVPAHKRSKGVSVA